MICCAGHQADCLRSSKVHRFAIVQDHVPRDRGLCLLGIAIIGYKIVLLEASFQWKPGFWVGIFLIFEWHLVWAAVSGMEMLLFACSVLLTMYFSARKPVNWILTGCLIGTRVWIRPDGITLLGPIALLVLFDSTSWNEKLKTFFKISMGLVFLIAVYLIFNRWSGGNLFPNTFSAKQAEYLGMQAVPIWQRFASQFSMLLVGGGVLLMPGFIYISINSFKKRYLPGIGWFLWILGYLFIYAWRLPVTYQHGRYAFPAMIVYFVLGLIYLIDRLRERGVGHVRVYGGGGGVIVPEEIEALQAYGVARIFSPEDGRRLGLEGMIGRILEECRAHARRLAPEELI